MRASDIFPNGRVSLREVALGDGLQLAKTYPNTATKINWMKAEYAAGVRHFEVGWFLPEKSFPQFADTLDVISFANHLDRTCGAVVTWSERGVKEALTSGVPEIICVVSASEAHCRRNVHRTMAEALETVRTACRQRDSKAHRPVISVSVAVAFGCPISGAVAETQVLELVEKCLEAGVDIISLADSGGYALPRQVERLVGEATGLAGSRPVGIHLHDSRGLGLINAATAIEAGATIIDASLGGLGPCSVVRGARGNLVLEDLVYLCENIGVETGINIESLMELRKMAASSMPTERLHGAMAVAGIPPFGHEETPPTPES